MKNDLYNEISKAFFGSQRPYDQVNILMLCWEDRPVQQLAYKITLDLTQRRTYIEVPTHPYFEIVWMRIQFQMQAKTFRSDLTPGSQEVKKVEEALRAVSIN